MLKTTFDLPGEIDLAKLSLVELEVMNRALGLERERLKAIQCAITPYMDLLARARDKALMEEIRNDPARRALHQGVGG